MLEIPQPCFFKVQKLTFFILIFAVKTCGKPHIQNIMSNVTAKPGQQASFKCQVDMSCIVAYIEWYHEMDNGTEKLIKVRVKPFISIYSIIVIENKMMLVNRSNKEK